MLLVIDTAANLCAACLWDETAGHPLASVTRDIGTGHAEQLMAVIDEALVAAGKTYPDVTKLGVVVGPGSFTGVRVGVSTVRGLALALRVPSVGVTTLHGLATEASDEAMSVLAVIDARREQFYSALYDAAGNLIAEPAVLDIETTLARIPDGEVVLTGSGAPAFADRLNGKVIATAASASIETYARLAASAPDQTSRPTPLYLRGADAKPQASFVLPGRDG
jgi:tRNA threonylcarbamoyladenosine biosynthesis protein TsaB